MGFSVSIGFRVAISGTEPQSALGAAIAEHVAAGTGAHALAESVGLGAVTVIRLKCTLRHYSFLFSALGTNLAVDAQRPNLEYRGN